jgi:endonuclease-3
VDRSAIVRLLISEGQRLFEARPTFVEFTKHADADKLLNDLDGHPHAYVLACIMDRLIKAERAWVIPYRFSEKLGDFQIRTLLQLSLPDVKQLMTEPEPLHRFPEEMSNNFHSAVQMIGQVYGGNAGRIWSGQPSSAEVVYRFLQFRGVGPKIATMATNILARDFKVPFADYYSIDLSVDVQVRRVFTRLGLAHRDDNIQSIIYLARALHPTFPGLLDYPAWEIGRNSCRPLKPLCDQCIMQSVCPSADGDV